MRALTHSLRGSSLLVLLALFAVSCSTPSTPGPVTNQSPVPAIKEDEVNKAQREWCEGLIEIATVSRNRGNYEEVANKFIDKAYDFNWMGRLFFRPTLAYKPNAFRTDRAAALSYFIGGNDHFPDGDGFARGPWVKCEYSNDLGNGVNGIQTYQDLALVMGTVTLTDCKDKKTTVDKVFVFRRQSSGELKLVVHMSAKANEPPTSPTPTPIPCPPQPK
jgi:hypothetical protein